MAADKTVKTSTQEELARHKAQQMSKGGQGVTWDGVVQFFRETWIELKKTTWPDKNTLTKSTWIVLAFILATAIWVGGIDNALTIITKRLLSH